MFFLLLTAHVPSLQFGTLPSTMDGGGGEPSLFTSRALRRVAMETGLDLSADEGRAMTH